MDTESNTPKVRVSPASLGPEALAFEAGPRPAWRGLSELHALACRIYPPQVNHRFAKRARFMYRASASPSVWLPWRSYLEASPFERLAQVFPRLYEKPLRPYLHRRFRPGGTLRMLRGHYQFLQQHAPVGFVGALLDNRPYLLNERSVDGLERPLLLNLTYAKHMQQEGELTLSLGFPDSLGTLGHHRWISSLTFMLRQGPGGREFLVGGVQGGHSADSREDIRVATQVFHGLRPKYLLIHLLRQLALCWGVSDILAVSDSAHCLTRNRYRGRIQIMSSYDELWRDVGGEFREDGFYTLPLLKERRPLEEIPSRKRAQYRRRYELLDNIETEIRDKLALS
ncbi:MAG TPA: DUF535 family protein [Gammaproteobacteria bacterium]|nr:DUF535 family protein [Gammaproteobacteria bacterium]